jgi:hypothetical protein
MNANKITLTTRKKGGQPKLPATEANKAISVRIDSRKKRIVVRDFVPTRRRACGFLVTDFPISDFPMFSSTHGGVFDVCF